MDYNKTCLCVKMTLIKSCRILLELKSIHNRREVIVHILSQEFLKISCLERYILKHFGIMENTCLNHIMLK